MRSQASRWEGSEDLKIKEIWEEVKGWDEFYYYYLRKRAREKRLRWCL